MIGAAVVGLGVGHQHALAYRKTPGCVLRRICDTDGTRVREELAALGPGPVPSGFDEILADPEVHIVSIASYDDAHYAQTLAALRAGKHVFVEKPLCRTSGELDALRDAWRAGGLHLASNLVLRAAPLYRWIEESRRSGRLGRIFAFDGDYLYGRLQKITEGWRKDVVDYSVMQGGGVHMIDLMLGLTGERPVEVHAWGNRIVTEGSAFRYRDFVAASFRFESGLVGRITANFGCVHRHQHAVRVFGTHGTVIYDDLGARLHESRDPAAPAVPIVQAPLPASKGDLIPDFIAAVRDGLDPAPAAEREFDVIRACLAVDESLAAGRPVEVGRS